MRKLLNTLYVTKEDGYLSLDGENVVLSSDGREVVRLPFTNLESIYCFNYLGCSPALMGKCANEQVGLCFLSPNGRFLARVTGETKGNVYLRKQQIECFNSEKKQLGLIKTVVTNKINNSVTVLKRSLRDYPEIDNDGRIQCCIDVLKQNIKKVSVESNIEVLRGLEGQSAKEYFYVFDLLIVKQRENFVMCSRSKHPPLDRVNAVLSFLYTMLTNDIASALECVGLDPYIGFYHTLRPGRVSLACDIMEQYRWIAERMVLSLINLKMLKAEDFETQVSGAVLLNDEGRKKVLSAWQSKKKDSIMHPIIKEKVHRGMYPYIEANLLAKYIRGETDMYKGLVIT